MDSKLVQAYTSAEPTDNTTLDATKDIVAYLGAVGVQTYGVFANPQNTRANFISVDELAKKGLSPSTHSLAFVVKVTNNPDDEDNSVKTNNRYANLAKLNAGYRRALADGSIAQFTLGLYNDLGILAPGGTAITKLLSVPSVGSAIANALESLIEN